MWITGEVEIPDEIVEAQEQGNLVIFVGAGASLAAPSNLPHFEGLAKKLARMASQPFSKRGGLDFFIGKLESLPHGFDAHQNTLNIVSEPRSKPNSLHHAIVRLAGIGDSFRIVTTNYDDHLATAAREQGISVPNTWYGPALPLGRDFSGLVHLHGSVQRPKEEIVITDRDFGHAYITDAWAARFLLPMFDRYTVAFIGYSHDDVIMRYLALGLPSDKYGRTSKRFAFTSEPGNSKWRHLGIQPVAYPASGRDHKALPAGLDAWADRATMGQTDHQARLQAIVGGGTALPVADRDYLKNRLQTVHGAREFTYATRGHTDDAKIEWLIWLEEETEFRTLFTESNVPEATVEMGHWFASEFISSKTLNGVALQALLRNGQIMTPSLHDAATWQSVILAREDNEAGTRWQALLATSILGRPIPQSTNLLNTNIPEPASISLPALRAILRPYLKLERHWLVHDSSEPGKIPNAKVAWAATQDDLTQLVMTAVKAAGPEDFAVGDILEDALVAAYELLDAYHGDRSFDRLAFHRSAIEPHPQNEFTEPIDAIIDGLRDHGARALPYEPELPERWWRREHLLLQRLALYLVTLDSSRNSNEKLSWLLDRCDLYEAGLKHETYQLLAATSRTASNKMKKKILLLASAGPTYPESVPDRERHIAYSKYNLLAWLKNSDPSWREAASEFDAIQTANPDFGIREHPDLDSWSTSDISELESPVEIDEFERIADKEPSRALERLIAFAKPGREFDQFAWLGSKRLARELAERRPDLGALLWDEIGVHTESPNMRVELSCSIVEGLANANLGSNALAIIERMEVLLPHAASAHVIGRFLLEQIRKRIGEAESPALASMRNLANLLWQLHSAGFTYDRSSDLFSFAPLYLNSWPGFLARYWNTEIDRRWRSSRDDWGGLNSEESNALRSTLTGPQDALDATQPAIAGELYFHFSADESFAKRNLLPLFSDPDRHAFAWRPFLHHARWNDRLLAAGFFDSIITELDRFDEIEDQRLRRVFLEMVVSVVSYSGITSVQRRRLLDKTVVAADGSLATAFAKATARFVHEASVDGPAIWRRWLGNHLERRLLGRPRIASKEELSYWADIVPAVGDYTLSAIELFKLHSVGFGDRPLIGTCPVTLLNDYGAEIVDFYTKRAFDTSNAGYGTKRAVQKLVDSLRRSIGDAVVQPLVDAASEKALVAVLE